MKAQGEMGKSVLLGPPLEEILLGLARVFAGQAISLILTLESSNPKI